MTSLIYKKERQRNQRFFIECVVDLIVKVISNMISQKFDGSWLAHKVSVDIFGWTVIKSIQTIFGTAQL